MREAQLPTVLQLNVQYHKLINDVPPKDRDIAMVFQS